MSLQNVMAQAANDYATRNAPGALGALTNSQIEGYFGGQSDIQAARSADPGFNLADWYKNYGQNEVMAGTRGLSNPVGNIYATDAGDTAFTSGLKAFDEQQYSANNQDVFDAMKGGQFASGYQHFMNFGQKEGRDPNARLGFLGAAAMAPGANPGMYDPNSANYSPVAGVSGQGSHMVMGPNGPIELMSGGKYLTNPAQFQPFGQGQMPYQGMYAQGYQNLSFAQPGQYPWLDGPTYDPGSTLEIVSGPGGSQQAGSGSPSIGGQNAVSTTDFLTSQFR
jgi:hypothetical protein